MKAQVKTVFKSFFFLVTKKTQQIHSHPLPPKEWWGKMGEEDYVNCKSIDWLLYDGNTDCISSKNYT